MKVKKLILQMYQAILKHDTQKEKTLWFKILRKSTNHKNTHVVK